jgi:OOP family OmpA-OmpF porin
VLALAAAAFALPAAAQSKLYLGFQAGQSHYNLSPCPSPCDDKAPGYKLYGGLGLHPNIALEVGYADLGKSTFGASNVRATLWEASGVGSWWFGQRQNLGVYGRLGVYTGDLKATAPSNGAEVKHGTTDLTYGLGGQMNLSRALGARVEWQRWSGMGGGGFGQKADVDLLSVGLLFKFQ